MLEALASREIAGGSCRGVGRCWWARAGGSRWSREPSPVGWRGLHQRWAGGRDSAESCWGPSPPWGPPGRGPCHTLLGGSFSRLGWHGIQLTLVSPQSLWSLVLLSLCPLVTDACVPASLWSLMLVSLHPLVADACVPSVMGWR